MSRKYELPQDVDQVLEDAVKAIKLRVREAVEHGSSDLTLSVRLSRWSDSDVWTIESLRQLSSDDSYHPDLEGRVLWSSTGDWWSAESEPGSLGWIEDESGDWIGDFGSRGKWEEFSDSCEYPANWKRFSIDYESWEDLDVYVIDKDELRQKILGVHQEA